LQVAEVIFIAIVSNTNRLMLTQIWFLRQVDLD